MSRSIESIARNTQSPHDLAPPAEMPGTPPPRTFRVIGYGLGLAFSLGAWAGLAALILR
ncbi:hypothetical protein ACO2Q1_11105 [Brevundimonas sp. VNH65]|uniref:hypothetical protein n=1 Tax=Brevundimonas sp. VNH65 TaxID=3400917 RepID=UPI003C05D822